MDRQVAVQRARDALDKAGHGRQLKLVGDDSMVDLGWAWVCPWSTERWFATRDPRDAQPPGFGPIVVVKQTGETWFLGSGTPSDDQLAEYARARGWEHTARLG